MSVRRCVHRVWSSSSRGLTLIELMVTLLILSILAAAAVPYAELTVRRGKEMDLRRTLREVRTAIDRFHEDWRVGNISKTGEGVSDDGFPKTLEVLVDGAEAGDAKGGKRKYLRRVPRDPLGEADKDADEQWVLRGYQDEPDALSWNRVDVYDLRTANEGTAIDGTQYQDW